MSAISQLDTPNGGINREIRNAAAEVILYVNEQARRGNCQEIKRTSWFNPASTPEHHVPGMAGQKGVAVDFMTTDRRTQDLLNDYVWAHRVRLGVCWIISRDRIRSTSPGKGAGWVRNGSGHYDHTHVNFGRLMGTSGYGRVANVAYRPLITRVLKPFKVTAGAVQGYDAKTGKSKGAKYLRRKGFVVRGTIVRRSDGRYIRTAFGTDYPLDNGNFVGSGGSK